MPAYTAGKTRRATAYGGDIYAVTARSWSRLLAGDGEAAVASLGRVHASVHEDYWARPLPTTRPSDFMVAAHPAV